MLKLNASYSKKVLDLDGDVQHNAFEDAKDTASVYRRLTELLTQA